MRLVGRSPGYRRGFIYGLNHLENRVAGNVALDVELAACARQGDTERTLTLLEQRIDADVLSLTAAHTNLGILTAQAVYRPEESLYLAKVYRARVPAVGQDASAVQQALDRVGTQPTSLSPGLAKLTHESGR